MDRQRGLYCAKKDMALRWIHRVGGCGSWNCTLARRTFARALVSLLIPFFLHYFLFGVNSLAFDSCSVLTLIFTFASFYKMDGFDGFYESLLVRRGGVFLLFFSYFITFYLLGYFRIVFFSFFLSGHMVLRLQFARAFEKWEPCLVAEFVFSHSLQTLCPSLNSVCFITGGFRHLFYH